MNNLKKQLSESKCEINWEMFGDHWRGRHCPLQQAHPAGHLGTVRHKSTQTLETHEWAVSEQSTSSEHFSPGSYPHTPYWQFAHSSTVHRSLHRPPLHICQLYLQSWSLEQADCSHVPSTQVWRAGQSWFLTHICDGEEDNTPSTPGENFAVAPEHFPSLHVYHIEHLTSWQGSGTHLPFLIT